MDVFGGEGDEKLSKKRQRQEGGKGSAMRVQCMQLRFFFLQ